MNKVEFCAKMAERTGMSKAEAARQYDNVVGCLYDFVTEGEDVSLFGLCHFKSELVEAHEARNPATGETITIPARKRLIVKVSKTAKDAVKALPVG